MVLLREASFVIRLSLFARMKQGYYMFIDDKVSKFKGVWGKFWNFRGLINLEC